MVPGKSNFMSKHQNIILLKLNSITFKNVNIETHMIFLLQDDLLVGASTWHRFKTNRRFLKIKSVEIGDSGIFVCKGVNGFGSVSVQIQLVVRGMC